MSHKHLIVRRRFDTAAMTRPWQPHCYDGPPTAPSELIRGMWMALLPAAAFWSGLAAAGYWLIAAP